MERHMSEVYIVERFLGTSNRPKVACSDIRLNMNALIKELGEYWRCGFSDFCSCLGRCVKPFLNE